MPAPSKHTIAYCLIAILTLVVIFHLLVVAGIIPYTIVWGSRISSPDDVIIFELVSITINLIMITILCLYTGLLKFNVHPLVLRIAIGIMAGIFAVNTVGNLYSESQVEKAIFTPITFVLSGICLYLIFGSTKKEVPTNL